jgi:hypothetical protein
MRITKKSQFDQSGVTLTITDSDRNDLFELFNEVSKQTNTNLNDKTATILKVKGPEAKQEHPSKKN